LLIAFVVLGGAGYAAYRWASQTPAPSVVSRPALQRPTAPATPKTIVSHPTLPVAAPKSVSKKARTPAGRYTVSRGDTLWRIAAVHSPVRQGPGWVAIWKANRSTVKDFDRIEVGWNLQIPQRPQDYVTRFWKPRMLAVARAGTAPALRRVAVLHRPLMTPESADWPPVFPAELARALTARDSRTLPADIVLALEPAKKAPTATRAIVAKAPAPHMPRRASISPAAGRAQLASYDRTLRRVDTLSFSPGSWASTDYR
jgi:hypothetical protein